MRNEVRGVVIESLLTEMLGSKYNYTWQSIPAGCNLITSSLIVSQQNFLVPQFTQEGMTELVERVCGDIHEKLVTAAARIRL